MRIYFVFVSILLLIGCESAEDQQVRLEQLEATRKATQELNRIINNCQTTAKEKYPVRNKTKLVWENVYTGDRVTGSRRSCFPKTLYTQRWCMDTPITEPIYIRTQVEKTIDLNSTKRFKSQNACVCDKTQNSDRQDWQSSCQK